MKTFRKTIIVITVITIFFVMTASFLVCVGSGSVYLYSQFYTDNTIIGFVRMDSVEPVYINNYLNTHDVELVKIVNKTYDSYGNNLTGIYVRGNVAEF